MTGALDAGAAYVRTQSCRGILLCPVYQGWKTLSRAYAASVSLRHAKSGRGWRKTGGNKAFGVRRRTNGQGTYGSPRDLNRGGLNLRLAQERARAAELSRAERWDGEVARCFRLTTITKAFNRNYEIAVSKPKRGHCPRFHFVSNFFFCIFFCFIFILYATSVSPTRSEACMAVRQDRRPRRPAARVGRL